MTDSRSGSTLTLKELFAIAVPDSDGDGATASVPAALSDLVSVEVKDAKIEPAVMLDGIVDQITSFLDIEVSVVIAEAWSKAKQLQEYRDPTRHPPGELSSVAMVEHTISSRYHPSIDLMINGKRVNSLAIDVGVQLALEALVLEIQNARVMAVRPGRFTASGKITFRDTGLYEMESRPVELPGRQALGEGIPIPELGESEAPGGTAV